VEILAAPFFARKEIRATGIAARISMITAFLGMVSLLKASPHISILRHLFSETQYIICLTAKERL